MDCDEYQKDNRWLRNRIVMNITEGIMSDGWILVNIRMMKGLRNRVVESIKGVEK